jgi:hypothetical protein
LIIIVAATSVHAAGYFVDADAGDDTNPGISEESPFASIQRAINAASENPGPDMIRIASGEYAENLVINDDEKLVLNGSDGAVVTAADAEDDVIAIKAGDVTISDLEVTGGDNGIKTKGSETSLTLREVDVSDNADRGLNAKSVGSVTIIGGSFSDNGGDAIKVGDEDSETYVESLTVTGTTFSNNDSDGLDLEKITTVIVRDTIVDGSGDEGLEVDICVSVTVIGGAYTNNADDGLDIDNSQSVRVVSVLSTGNGEGNGLQIELEEGFEMEEATIVNCEFLGNGQNGVQIVEDGGVVHFVKLTDITARDNVESGLQIVISGSAKLADITSEDNGAGDVLP